MLIFKRGILGGTNLHTALWLCDEILDEPQKQLYLSHLIVREVMLRALKAK
jgi:hypothetical protein